MTENSIIDSYTGPADVVQASYAELLADGNEFYTVDSTGLLPKEILIGVPFVITGVTYQAVPVAKKGDQPRGFVSVEATIGDLPALTRAVGRRQVPNVAKVDELMVDPEERVVFNDGSTGIRRQLTCLLDAYGIVTVGNGEPTSDPRTDKRFDIPWSIGDKLQWESAGEQWRDMGDNPPVPYITRNHKGNALLIPVRRGLRVSAYSDEVYGDAETYYLG